jgi:long-subunit acyl-CoA synthetase (AMP-forming)
MQMLSSSLPLGPCTPNVGTMLLRNRERFGPNPAFAERRDGPYQYWTWQAFVDDVLRVAAHVCSGEAPPEDSAANRVALVAGNSYHRLITEMAVMAAGRTAVPIFAGYASELMSDLVEFADVGLLVTDEPGKAASLRKGCLPPSVLVLGDHTIVPPLLEARLRERGMQQLFFIEELLALPLPPYIAALSESMRRVSSQSLAMIMFTSGTSSFPKGVMLTHANLMSQQRSLDLLWAPDHGMRFLCYLPWHHSFGGLFERLFALHSGGCLAIDDSWGKDISRLLENFAAIRPNVYFSVPKVYQEIIGRILANPERRDDFFHEGLKFVFTAAAPLPMSTSEIFRNKGVAVVEGWGLTETSPSCTLTDPSKERTPGVVGFPLPEVDIRLGPENEIQVRGPNVMRGYFRRPDLTAKAFTDGWFRTGDVGAIMPDGLKIISRLDRMFKLNNGEKVFPASIEDRIAGRCKFIKYAYVFGTGQEHPSLLAFPNFELMTAEDGGELDRSECVYPGCVGDLAGCLGECIEAEQRDGAAFERVDAAAVVNSELTVEANQLTPSFKLIPRKIEEDFREHIQALTSKNPDALPGDAHVIDLEKK